MLTTQDSHNITDCNLRPLFEPGINYIAKQKITQAQSKQSVNQEPEPLLWNVLIQSKCYASYRIAKSQQNCGDSYVVYNDSKVAKHGYYVEISSNM